MADKITVSIDLTSDDQWALARISNGQDVPTFFQAMTRSQLDGVALQQHQNDNANRYAAAPQESKDILNAFLNESDPAKKAAALADVAKDLQ